MLIEFTFAEACRLITAISARLTLIEDYLVNGEDDDFEDVRVAAEQREVYRHLRSKIHKAMKESVKNEQDSDL